MNLIRPVALLVYTFGLFGYGTVFFLWLRQYGRAGWVAQPRPGRTPCRSADLVGGAILFTGTAWFAVCLLLVFASLLPGVRLWPVQMAGLVLTCLWPPLIAHTTYAEVTDAGRRPPIPWQRLVVGGIYLSSAAVLAFAIPGFLGTWGIPSPRVSAIAGISIAVLFTLTGVYSVVAVRGSRRGETTAEERRSSRWILGMFSAMTVLFLLLVLAYLKVFAWSEILEVTVRSLPLAFLFVGTYFENRFEFYDLLFKRGLSLLLAMILLTASLAVLFPWLEGRFPASFRPWVFAFALLPLAAALPGLHRVLGRWLDRAWLGRQFTPEEAVRHFLEEVRNATTEAELVERAERGIGAIFRAPVAIRLGGETPDGGDTGRGVEVPLEREGRRIGRIRMGPRESAAPYFAADVTLLASLAQILGSLLENVRLQQARQEEERRARELSLHASRSELKALRAQINPHFLFNALNAIAGLIPRDPARADRAVEQLAEVFRYTLRRSESEWARLGDELELVRAYLEVEQARFGPRLEVRIDADPGAADLPVPTLVLQTLVENAVKHGVSGQRGAGRIEVAARSQNGWLTVEVADNGPGFGNGTGSPAGGTGNEDSGFGLRSVRERLRSHYGSEAALSIRRDADRGMTVVAVRIPLRPDATLEAKRGRGPGGGGDRP
jgi:two-component system LytT family sensor kinase